LETININIEGYWRDKHRTGLPAHSGIFLVYEATYNLNNDTVKLLKVIYVGEAANLRERLSNHPHYEEWKQYLQSGEELCYSIGHVSDNFREQVKAAFIFDRKPIANTRYKDDFPFPATNIICSGKTALLQTNFVVNPS